MAYKFSKRFKRLLISILLIGSISCAAYLLGWSSLLTVAEVEIKGTESASVILNELKSKGYPAKVFGTTKTGLHRVAISTFNNETEALENLSQLRLTFAGNTWLLNN